MFRVLFPQLNKNKGKKMLAKHGSFTPKPHPGQICNSSLQSPWRVVRSAWGHMMTWCSLYERTVRQWPTFIPTCPSSKCWNVLFLQGSGEMQSESQ